VLTTCCCCIETCSTTCKWARAVEWCCKDVGAFRLQPGYRASGPSYFTLACSVIFLVWSAFVGFEIPGVVVMKTSLSWDVILCRPLKLNWSLEDTYRLHLQDQGISKTRNQHESRRKVDFQHHIPEDSALNYFYVRFEVFTAVTVKNVVFLGYKDPVRTSQETHYISVTESSQLMLWKIWGFHRSHYEECHLLGCYAMWLL
jgi:hypothetical protein